MEEECWAPREMAEGMPVLGSVSRPMPSWCRETPCPLIDAELSEARDRGVGRRNATSMRGRVVGLWLEASWDKGRHGWALLKWQQCTPKTKPRGPDRDGDRPERAESTHCR